MNGMQNMQYRVVESSALHVGRGYGRAWLLTQQIMMTESVSELVGSGDGETPSPTSNNHQRERPEGEEPPSYDTLDQPVENPPPYSPSFAVTTVNRMFNIPEAPPDYFSVVANRIQDARRDSDSFSSFCAKAFRTIFFATTVLFVLNVLISIPVGMLAIGAGYLGDCPIEPMIPVYMIVAGLCGIIKSVEAVLKQIMVCSKASSLQNCLQRWKKHPKLKYFLVVWRIADLIFNLLLLGLFIAGSYWVFHVYADLRRAGFPSMECNPILYKISFGLMVSIYIILALTCCCVCGCALCRIKTAEEEQAPPTAVRRRPVLTAQREIELSSHRMSTDDVFSSSMQSNQFYQETTELNNDFASVDLSLADVDNGSS